MPDITGANRLLPPLPGPRPKRPPLQTGKTDGQRTEAKEIAAAIKNNESELAALKRS